MWRKSVIRKLSLLASLLIAPVVSALELVEFKNGKAADRKLLSKMHSKLIGFFAIMRRRRNSLKKGW